MKLKIISLSLAFLLTPAILCMEQEAPEARRRGGDKPQQPAPKEMKIHEQNLEPEMHPLGLLAVRCFQCCCPCLDASDDTDRV
jgi:hypothetical protein